MDYDNKDIYNIDSNINNRFINKIDENNLESDLDIKNPDFVDNFNRLIEESHLKWKSKIKENPNYPNEYIEEINIPNKYKKSTLTNSNKQSNNITNIFKEPPSWKYPSFYGKEFDKFKILKHQKYLNNWEIYRINLNDKSYYKEAKELKEGKKHFKSNNYYGKEFSSDKDVYKNLMELGYKDLRYDNVVEKNKQNAKSNYSRSSNILMSNKSIKSGIKLSNSRNNIKELHTIDEENIKNNNNNKNNNNKNNVSSPTNCKLINTFIRQNIDNYASNKKLEEEVYNYKHSKPPIELNNWKYSKEIGDYFSTPKIDKVYAFKIPLKSEFKNKKPFLVTKQHGDYFNKIDLSSEYNKYMIK